MAETFNVIAPILIISLIGYLFGRSKFDLHVATLSNTVIIAALPALLFSSLTTADISLERVGEVFLAALVVLGIAAVLSLVVVKVAGFSVRTCLPSLIFPNSGNMGLPLAYIAFGDLGLGLAVAYFVVVTLWQHTAGMTIASGEYRFKAILQQPLIYAVVAILLVIGFDLPVPEVIATTTDLLGGMMIPAMLILLGNSLASLKVSDFVPACIMAVARLLIGIVSGMAGIWLLGLTGTLAGIVFMLAAMPAAVVTYVYAERYRPDAELVAGTIVLSTLLTFALLPLIIWGAQAIAAH